MNAIGLSITRHKVKVVSVVVIALLYGLWQGYYHYEGFYRAPVMVTSVSSDGRYAITTSVNKRAYLWDLNNHRRSLISADANIYSAYFIKHSNDFIWQDEKTRHVIVQNTKGQRLKDFDPGFVSYGEVMTTDLNTYIASDFDWNLFKINHQHKVQMKLGDGGFYSGKLLNLSLSSDDRYLLSSGVSSNPQKLVTGKNYLHGNFYPIAKLSKVDGVVLWDVASGHPIRKYSGDVDKDFAILSPADRYVLSCDDNDFYYIWTLMGRRLIRSLGHDMVSPKNYGYLLNFKGSPYYEPNSHIDDMPLAVRFIDKTHYLSIIHQTPWAELFSIANVEQISKTLNARKDTSLPKVLKLYYLGDNPGPSIVHFLSDQTIDSSWRAHVLVTGQYGAGGINVYRYNPMGQTLRLDWIAKPRWY